MKFEQYSISPVLKKNLFHMGLKRPTDIQYKAIPSILKGEDVLAIAQTGTGKTAAFAIPVVERILAAKSGGAREGIQCIVMVPTRELAVQIQEVFSGLAKKTRVRSLAVFGGVEQDPQIQDLSTGIDVLIATPGRMFDLISQGVIQVSGVKILVLDEADQMLAKGFLKDIESIKKKLTHRHQTLFFSATINREIKRLAFSQVNSRAIRIQISPDDPVSKNVSHYVVHVDMDDKRFFLRRFVRDHSEAKILVFVRTLVRAERVKKALERGHIPSLTIHRDKDQAERLSALAGFRSGGIRILVATDVSARGIDIPNVDYVINYDLPDQAETYVHRVGRTGRGRAKGVAISFCSAQEKGLLEAIESFINKRIDQIQLKKEDYALTVDVLDGPETIEEMIRANEAWEKKKRGQRARRKGQAR